jgi:hypothetical protein
MQALEVNPPLAAHTHGYIYDSLGLSIFQGFVEWLLDTSRQEKRDPT